MMKRLKINENNKNYESASTKIIEELLYFSDLTLGLNNMSEAVELKLTLTISQ